MEIFASIVRGTSTISLLDTSTLNSEDCSGEDSVEPTTWFDVAVMAHEN